MIMRDHYIYSNCAYIHSERTMLILFYTAIHHLILWLRCSQVTKAILNVLAYVYNNPRLRLESLPLEYM